MNDVGAVGVALTEKNEEAVLGGGREGAVEVPDRARVPLGVVRARVVCRARARGNDMRVG